MPVDFETEHIVPPAFYVDRAAHEHEAGDVPSGRSSSKFTAVDEKEATPRTSVGELGKEYEGDGVIIVTFEKGAGEDPHEFSHLKKWAITLATSFLCLAVTLGSSIITGDLMGPVADLHTTQEIVNLTVTCFVIGFGVGPLFFAPLSEVVGRRPMYCISFFFYWIFTLPSALAKNTATLVVARQIAGLAASAPMCNVAGSISDIWFIEERGVPMAIFSATVFMGPCLGPLLGGFIGEYAGWRWIYWVLFMLTGALFVCTLFIPETLAPVLLARKAARLRAKTGDQNYRTAEELARAPFAQTLRVALLRPLIMIVAEPIVLFMSFYLSFIYSLLYLFFFAFPIAFAEIRGYSAGITGVAFLSVVIGIGLGMCLVPTQERIYRKVTAHGTFPEARLYPMMLGAVILPISLVMFAFTGAYAHVNFMGPCAAGAVFGFAIIFLYVSANSYIIDAYSDVAASALAAKTLMRSLVGATVPLFVNQMFHAMGFQWAGLALAGVAVLVLPIPFVFYRYGEGVRGRSSRASKAVRGHASA